MFQRRKRLPIQERLGQWIWPRMGWRRTVTYYWHRLRRIPGTASSIAAGFACGAAAAMTPFYGTHIVTAGFLAWAIRGNVFAAVLGAQIANPWTGPPLWFGAYYLGASMVGIDLGEHPPNFVQMFKGLIEAILNADIEVFRANVWPVFWPMIVGSIPMAIVAGFAAYFGLLPVLRAVHLERVMRRVGRRAVGQSLVPGTEA